MTGQTRISRKFADLRPEGRAALMPFITAGDPDLDFTGSLLLKIQDRGASLVELGIPFSDPVADGPVIQSSFTRALGKGLRLQQTLDWFAALRPRLKIPVVAMVSFSIVYRRGPERFVQEAKNAGFDGAIIPDLPTEEGASFLQAARALDFDTIFLVAPTTPPQRRREIVSQCTGFVYYVSVTGITGARDSLPDDIVKNIDELKSLTRVPVAVGFGVSNPRQAEILARHADGVIVGSAIVKMLENAANEPRQQLIEKIGSFVASLVEASSKGPAR